MLRGRGRKRPRDVLPREGRKLVASRSPLRIATSRAGDGSPASRIIYFGEREKEGDVRAAQLAGRELCAVRGKRCTYAAAIRWELVQKCPTMTRTTVAGKEAEFARFLFCIGLARISFRLILRVANLFLSFCLFCFVEKSVFIVFTKTIFRYLFAPLPFVLLLNVYISF